MHHQSRHMNPDTIMAVMMLTYQTRMTTFFLPEIFISPRFYVIHIEYHRTLKNIFWGTLKNGHIGYMNHIDRGFFLEMKKIKHNVRTAEPNRGEFSYSFLSAIGILVTLKFMTTQLVK
jgi:hypothetical protein